MGEKRKKGLGGLTPEKKKLLKQLIMAKAAEDIKKKQAEEQAAKKLCIEGRMPKLETDGKDEAFLKKHVKQLYDYLVKIEDDKYEWEVKIRKQEYELNELQLKVNDIKGKFVKPVLKKVSKAEQKLAKFDKSKFKE